MPVKKNGFYLLPNRTGIVDRNIITKKEEISIIFDYPFYDPDSGKFVEVAFKFKHKGGFTMELFQHAVVLGYMAIYEEGTYDFDLVDLVMKENIGFECYLSKEELHEVNKKAYHAITDLILEGFGETRPGVFELKIGS